MSKGKEIFDGFLKKIAARKEMARKKSLDKGGKSKSPPSVNVFKTNKPTIARSLNIHPTPPVERNISVNEGRPTVNASSDVDGLIHKPKQINRHPLDNPTAGHIEEKYIRKSKDAKGKVGRPKKNQDV